MARPRSRVCGANGSTRSVPPGNWEQKRLARTWTRFEKDLLEADFPLREPGEPEGGCGYGLLAGKVDGSFPVLVGEIAGDFELPPNAFDHLEIDLVEGGSAWDKVLFEIGGGKFAAGLRVLDDSAWDKALGGLLIA